MLPAESGSSSEGRTAADNQTVRNVFVVGPDKKIKLVLVYPMTTGRNFDEVLRVIDSLQLTAKHKVATPVNWKHGEDVIIAGSVSDEDAKKTYPQGLEGAQALHPHRAAAALASGLPDRYGEAQRRWPVCARPPCAPDRCRSMSHADEHVARMGKFSAEAQ